MWSLKKGLKTPKSPDYVSGALDVCIGHLSRTYDQIENMLLIRERLVVALPKGHSAAAVEMGHSVKATPSGTNWVKRVAWRRE